MAARRSRPLMMAPFVPLWGIVAFFGAEELRGTRYMVLFVILMMLALTGLFAYVAERTLAAKRSRSGR